MILLVTLMDNLDKKNEKPKKLIEASFFMTLSWELYQLRNEERL